MVFDLPILIRRLTQPTDAINDLSFPIRKLALMPDATLGSTAGVAAVGRISLI
jgi:hypothetical protein